MMVSEERMTITPIRSKRDYERALRRIEELMDANPRTKAGDELDVLTTLVEAYEAKHYAVCPPDPIVAIKFRMDQLGMTRKDLETMLGGRGRVSEILTRKRGLSLEMIRRLHRKLRIPLESLIGTAA
jgi:HTH-type transcriptional regulator/antitoxin HigA